MALASNAKECLHQNLRDARCSKEQIKRCMELSDIGDQGRMLFILKEHRQELLDTIHAHQKALDSLDYLLFQTEKRKAINDEEAVLKSFYHAGDTSCPGRLRKQAGKEYICTNCR